MEKHRDIIFLLFISVVVILSAAYFFVPERVLFMENEIVWWDEFLEAVKGVLS